MALNEFLEQLQLFQNYRFLTYEADPGKRCSLYRQPLLAQQCIQIKCNRRQDVVSHQIAV